MIELVKLPVPLPLLVLLLDVVGLEEVLQHTPLAVTDDDPEEVTFPPQVAVFFVIFVTEFDVTVGLPLITVTLISEDEPSFPASSRALARIVCF